MSRSSAAGPFPAPLVAALFGSPPTDVVVYEQWGDGDLAALDAAEVALVANAVDGRRTQFAAGRQCIHRALADLGLDRGPLLAGEQRSPRWPPDVLGSITHTDGYAAAAVAPAVVAPSGNRWRLGLDAERLGRVDDHLFSRLFVAAERTWLDGLDGADRDRLATAMFGAKEAFYKAQFGETGAWVGFHDVEIRIEDPAPGAAMLLHPATDLDALSPFVWPVTARHLVRDGVAVTAVATRLR